MHYRVSRIAERGPQPFRSLDGVRFDVRVGTHPHADALARRRYRQRGLGVGGGVILAPGITVLARRERQLWATLRLGLDSIAGLNADLRYREQLDRLRGAGRRLAEITRLAIDAPCPAVLLLPALFANAVRLLRPSPGVTDLVIEVNPRHARFYVQRFGFVQIGGETTCERVGAPAILLHRSVAPGDEERYLAA